MVKSLTVYGLAMISFVIRLTSQLTVLETLPSSFPASRIAWISRNSFFAYTGHSAGWTTGSRIVLLDLLNTELNPFISSSSTGVDVFLALHLIKVQFGSDQNIDFIRSHVLRETAEHFA